MTMYDIILKKRNGGTLTEEEIRYFVAGVTDGSIPDYQTAALMMAVYFNGMDRRETSILTDAMVHSGETVDLSQIDGIKVDKHSTGGVGDKTTLALAPILAACGLKVAKMSGRGLGHTGGTLDKIESIPGCTTQIDRQRFIDIVNDIGICVIGQTADLAPADKKLYALRDVTATVDNISLIAASIMSKKLAAGADIILLDVKYGSGAFMKTPEDACALAREMVDIGTRAGRKTAAMITCMDLPLGSAVGNTLEVAEAAETLKGNGPADFTELCLTLAEKMLVLAGKGTAAECRALAEKAVADGSALEKLAQMVTAQGGDPAFIADTGHFAESSVLRAVKSRRDGVIAHMDTERIGRASVVLGAGREKKEDPIDPAAGIRILKKTGDRVACGETVAYLYTEREEAASVAEEMYLAAVTVGETVEMPPLVYAYVDENGIHKMNE